MPSGRYVGSKGPGIVSSVGRDGDCITTTKVVVGGIRAQRIPHDGCDQYNSGHNTLFPA